MKNTDDTIYLIYNLDRVFRDKYQGIFYGHIEDGTHAVGARFYDVEGEGNCISSMKADFRCMTMGGEFKLSLLKKGVKMKYQAPHRRFSTKIPAKLAKEEGTSKMEGLQFEFDPPFNPNEHIMRIDLAISQKKKQNAQDGKINLIDDERSCLVKFGGG